MQVVRTLGACIPLLLTVFLLNACQPQSKVPPMTADEAARMAPITSRLTTRCAGRYLIDVPEIFVLSPVHLNTVEKVEVSIQPMTKSAFEMKLRYRRMELEAERNIYHQRNPTLERVVELADGVGLLFNRAESTSSNYFRVWELQTYRDGFAIEMLSRHVDGKYASDPKDPGPTTTNERFDHLLKMLARTRPRADNEIPTEQGLCIANGFISGPPTNEEETRTSYTVKGAEDGSFGFEYMSTIGPEKTTLLDRRAAVEPRLKAAGGRMIRIERRSVNGLTLDEMLVMALHEQTKKERFMFKAEMNSLTGNATQPLFVLGLSSGNGIARLPESLDEMASRQLIEKPIFSEAETLAIWDLILPTLRKRPGAF